ncbi:uncharacterized protein LOC110736649 [Chenopodium quinoa]|uniref:uncharacterized protein LOC110736649 n=1 Tax=Chenopodium quinoa TaxID=63459 RepID=UPI000B797F00|nr:uncharacterized protein LOC110736649 [Chenopodium quinoa]
MIAYPEGHRKISGLSPNAKQVVRDMTKSKVAPRNIMASIAEQFPADHPNIRHIYNCRNDFREEMSDGRGVVQQFLHSARQSQYVYWVMSDDEGVLQHAFMAHPVMVDILQTYPYVIGWWTEHHDPSVDGWDQRYEARRNMWDALIRQ